MAGQSKGLFEQENIHQSKSTHWSRQPHHRPILSETSTNIVLPRAAVLSNHYPTGKPRSLRPSTGHTLDAIGSKPEAAAVPTKEQRWNEDGHRAAETATMVEISVTHTPQLKHANTFPCTPNPRIPLEDLIGDCDAAKHVAPVEESPEEQISWVPNSSSNVMTPHHKRKRARSSSPVCPTTCSQQRKAALQAAQTQSADKPSPEADPTADLWRLYANGKPIDNIAELTKSAFEASPRPLLETPVRSGGFRRWVSTGNDWPNSRNKRVCMNTRTNIKLWQDHTAAETGGKSKVAAMVEKIQESLSSQSLLAAQHQSVNEKSEAPSSSSPLPGVKMARTQERSGFSPVRKAVMKDRFNRRAMDIHTESADDADRNRTTRQPPAILELTLGHSVESKNIVASDIPGLAPLHFRKQGLLPAYKRPSIVRAPIATKPDAVVKAGPVLAQAMDEFAEDFDLTADDIDEIMGELPAVSGGSKQGSIEDREAVSHSIDLTETDHNSGYRPNPRIPHLKSNDDEFGGSDIDEDDFALADVCATQALRMLPHELQNCDNRLPSHPSATKTNMSPTSVQSEQRIALRRHDRFIIKQVQEGRYVTEGNQSREETVLLAQTEASSRLAAITLRDSWTATIVKPGDIIHIAEAPLSRKPGLRTAAEPTGQILVDDSDTSPFLIVHPDHMLSATTVADSFDCVRKAVLQNLIKATGETSKAMVYGSILHEIFQKALSANQWDPQFLDDTAEKTVQAHVEGLWELGMRDQNLAIEEIRAKMGEVAAWADTYVSAQPSDTALVDDRQGQKVWMSISKLIAIEEHVWSPMYGLKGNIDATIEAHLFDHPDRPGKKLILPFEVKTGRTTQSPAHRAQTALYTLLLSDRYDTGVTAGILYYLESSSIYRIAPPVREVRQMIQQRNRLAVYIFRARQPQQSASDDQPDALASQIVEGSDLPNLLKTPFKCSKCYAQQSCFTYHALKENGTAETAGMVDDNKKNHSLIWQESVGHLLQSKTQGAGRVEILRKWYTKWDRLLTFEEGDQIQMRRELWTMSSAQRQKVGRCFGNLVLKHHGSTSTRAACGDVDGVGGKINRYTYSFVRSASAASASFTEATQLVVGEPIVVSSEQGQWALANGYVVAVSKHELQVAVDRKLGEARRRSKDFDEESNQSFRGIKNVSSVRSDDGSTNEKSILYRVDKDEFSNGLSLIRNNLLTLMSPHPIHTKLREQIVYGESPKFAASTMEDIDLQDSAMNEDQRKAVNTVLSTNDFALILGMPGTGKTTTIAQIIKALLAEKKSILLTSFTHTAVDNILLKIRDLASAGSILRLGVPAKINPQVQEFCLLASTNQPRTSIDEVEEAYMNTSIVASTCMGTNHALFRRRTFDVCIVDEASQITLPTILGPLLCARKFVLVGDHFQLPPLVQNRLALEGGLDESLFRMLCQRNENEQAVVELGCQYRMCKEIMSLSNQMIYGGRLSCGNEQVANRTLQLPQHDGLASVHEHGNAPCGFKRGECWLANATNPESKVIFLNTDPLGQAANEYLDGGTKNITNPAEASLCLEAMLALLAQGVKARDIGIITPYRSQVALLRRLLRSITPADTATTPLRMASIIDVEVDTPDRYQGRDKEVIIISLVRSNTRGDVGELLRDSRRVNVALTRARSKVMLVGSKSTLRNGSDLLSGTVSIIDEADLSGEGMCMLNLPKNALEGHSGLGSCASQQPLALAKEICSPTPKKRKVSSPEMTTSKRHHSVASDPPSANADRSLTEDSPSRAIGGHKKGPKIITRHAGQLGGKMKKMKEALAIEIWEDMIGEDDELDDF